MLPENQVTFLEADFLAFANEAMDMGVVPSILIYHEDYLMREVVVPLDPNTPRYKIPDRAIGNKIREVQYRDVSGILFEMTRISIEDKPAFQYTRDFNSAKAFYMEGDELVLLSHPPLSVTGSLVFHYYCRPSELVPNLEGAKITSIDTVNNIITLDNYSTTFQTNSTFDITSHKSPFKITSMDVQPSAYGSQFDKKLQFTVLPAGIEVGDFVTLSEQAIVPQIPMELHSMLAQRAAILCLEALGDVAGSQVATARLQEMEMKTGQIIDNRVEGAPLKVSPRHSFLRQNRRYPRR
jgi:hypothetical protein